VLVAALATVLTNSVGAAASTAPASSTRTITATGRIGSLRLGSSTQEAILTALGAPEGEAEGTFGDPNEPDYRGLGYECTPQPGGERRPVGSRGPPYCRTVYYLDTATGVLGGFWTISTQYATNHGTRVGTSEQVAVMREHHPATIGCLSGIGEISRGVLLDIEILGGKIEPAARPDEADHIVGGRVNNIAMESRRDPVGVLFC
jgi:hypothetical protein